jgi:hypothetical protein
LKDKKSEFAYDSYEDYLKARNLVLEKLDIKDYSSLLAISIIGAYPGDNNKILNQRNIDIFLNNLISY